MGKAVDQFFSLGWPGVDETLRAEARQQVESLARALKQDEHDSEAQELLSQLPAAEARDLFIRLTWTGDAWIDLAVEEPLGATASYQTPRTVFGGAIVKSGRGKHPESVYTCPRGFDGDYKVRVEVTYNNEKNPAREATLEIITHEGTSDESIQKKTISLAKPKPVIVTLKGGRRKNVLPFRAPGPGMPEAPPAQDGNAPGAPAVKPDPAKALDAPKATGAGAGPAIRTDSAKSGRAEPAKKP
jgi:hypothetical protein